jgi:predicted O-linked N-acetylglucosamine transferase (SPINDLY family)
VTRPADIAEQWYQRGIGDLDGGRMAQAKACFVKALEHDPRHAKASNNLGTLLQSIGLLEEAEDCYRVALEGDGRLAQAWFNLGLLHLERRHPTQAIERLRGAIALDAGPADWHLALASALGVAGRPREALDSALAAAQRAPANSAIQLQLGNCLLKAGEQEAALAAFRRALSLEPGSQAARSSILRALQFVSSASPERVFAEHVALARPLQEPARTLVHANDPAPLRRLRVGYVASDFGDPSLACFVAPVLAAHDRSRFDVVCYSDLEPDTPACWRLRASADLWHATARIDDERLAARVRDDGIDILVDLDGHRAGGRRIALFAARTAPVQVAWPTYPGTTGLVAFDGRVADQHSCAPGDERFFSEPVIRMSVSQWCFRPPVDPPEVASLPAEKNGFVTFGAFHAMARITPEAIDVWARLLRRVATARLVIGIHGAGQLAAGLADRFRQAGVDPGRIEFRESLPLQSCLSAHDRIDVFLDAIPYSSASGSLYALTMGVPVVTLAGRAAATRGAAGVLAALGNPEWIAGTAADYVAIAAALAADPVRLAEVRQRLRPRLASSPLMDAAGFTRELEAAYAGLWRAWCAGQPARSAPEKAARQPARSRAAPRVLVDGVFFQDYNTGIARLWRMILQEWVASGFARNALLLDREGSAPEIEGVARRRVPKHDYGRLAADREMLQRVCDEEGAQVFVSTYYTHPLTTPAVMMAYDMIPEVLGFDLEQPEWREKRACIENARRHVAISRHTAEDLRRVHPALDPGAIAIAHPAAAPLFRPAGAAEVARFRSRHGIADAYFLLVGMRVEYKNGRALFRALEELEQTMRFDLVCVGGDTRLAPAEQRACAGRGVHMLRLDDADLRLAYGGAAALVFPSEYEGFGMPVVEAMSCGCPVITTSHASLPEVAGDAAIYVNPHDPRAIALALAEVRRPDVRQQMIDRGLARARTFSWARMAAIVATVLEEAASGMVTADAARAS